MADVCADGLPDNGYGDGSDGNQTLSSNETLTDDMNYENLTILSGVRLNTAGHTIRVCGTLTNDGTITDLDLGGDYGRGGSGGDGGWGYPPHHDPENGTSGSYGSPGTCSGAGAGGDGHGGGGGGGGAWNITCILVGESSGRDGGDGGDGGEGGGCVTIYAYNFDNQGLIHADGEDGENGQAGGNGSYKSYSCVFSRDQASGGGGGGAGGDGGNGGTVNIYYVNMLLQGNVSADGGLGGIGGSAGSSLCGNLHYAAGPSQRWELGASGADGGGRGGESDIGTSCGSYDAVAGSNGSDGAQGTVSTEYYPPLILGETNAVKYDLTLQINPAYNDGWIDGSNVMTVESKQDGLNGFYIRLDEALDPSPSCYMSETLTNPTWLSVDSVRHDEVRVLVMLDDVYDEDETFYLRVDYAGHPALNVIAQSPFMDFVAGMGFDEQNGTSMIYTVVEPWYAYMWLPVKDDGDNYNCDKTEAELSLTVPGHLVVVSNGVLQRTHSGPVWVTYDWVTHYDTAAYLFAMAATNYDQVTLDYYGMPVELYVWPDDADQVDKWYAVWDMLELFENLYGIYPFSDEKYAIYQWPEEAGGAMEHQTASGQPGNWDDVSKGYPRYEAMTAHELSHSWWGNLLTPETWNDMWWKEGLAVYSEAIWFANHPDPESVDLPENPGLPTLSDYMWHTVRPSVHWESAYVEDATDPNDIFGFEPHYLANPVYGRSPWVMHMLRHLVDPVYTDPVNGSGPKRFFEILSRFRSAHEVDGCITGDDFQSKAEDVCTLFDLYDDWSAYPGGQTYSNLNWFFNQWVYDGGAPAYRYTWRNRRVGGEKVLYLKLWQTQLEGPFTAPIDITLWTLTTNGLVEDRRTIWNAQDEQEYWLPRDGYVSFVEIDPDKWLLKWFAVPKASTYLSQLGRTSNAVDPISAINNKTQVAAGLTRSNQEHAYLWLAEPYYNLESGLTDLGTLSSNSAGTFSTRGDVRNTAFDINDDGRIVGTSEAAGGSRRAFLWLPGADDGMAAGIHEIPADGRVAGALGLNDIGHVVGFSGQSANDYRAVLWEYDASSETWEQTDIDTLGGVKSEAWAVNNNGDIVGCWYPTLSESHAFYWSAETGMTDLGEGQAFDINEAGEVVGYERESSETYATSWSYGSYSRAYTKTRIADSGSYAHAISNEGKVVGHDNGRAYLWEDGVGMDLNDLITVSACWVLRSAWDINEAGQIVGIGEVCGDLGTHVFLLDPEGTQDCNDNGILDACDISSGASPDCNETEVPMRVTSRDGTSIDSNMNGIPDECETTKLPEGARLKEVS